MIAWLQSFRTLGSRPTLVAALGLAFALGGCASIDGLEEHGDGLRGAPVQGGYVFQYFSMFLARPGDGRQASADCAFYRYASQLEFAQFFSFGQVTSTDYQGLVGGGGPLFAYATEKAVLFQPVEDVRKGERDPEFRAFLRERLAAEAPTTKLTFTNNVLLVSAGAGAAIIPDKTYTLDRREITSLASGCAVVLDGGRTIRSGEAL